MYMKSMKLLIIVVLGVMTLSLVMTGCASPVPAPSEERAGEEIDTPMPAEGGETAKTEVVEEGDGDKTEGSPEAQEVRESEEKEADLPLFTLEEIAQFDGKDGRPAYIVVDGIVYDVTNVPQWSSGSHYGFEAGKDVSEALAKSAPHGASLLSAATIVGKI